jgi:uncharacterized protein (TIGR00369 family)
MLVMPESVANDAVPAGFELLPVSGGYFKQLGPVYGKTRADGSVIVALRVAERHLNFGGVAHGGMLATVADGALGRNVAIARARRQAQVTVSLTADFLSGARFGDWLEAHVTVTRMGQRLAYANCDLMVGDRHVLRSSAVFAFVHRPWPAAPQKDAEPPAMEEG